MKDTTNYNKIVSKLSKFFRDKGFIEVPTQSRLSILAACEDPKTISTFVFNGKSWPLPQTGQMWLEYELLKNNYDGVFCVSTSYRNEPMPIPGRHDLIFPMFEFEGKGNYLDLKNLNTKLCALFGFNTPVEGDYTGLCNKYAVDELLPEHEESLWKQTKNPVMITNFPETTHPFWNMKENKEGTYNKADVILGGMETFGTAERETDVEKMRDRFHTLSDGEYAGLLYRHFGEERVEKELEDYLSLPMFPRFGGGIGVTRLRSAILAQ